MNLVLIITAAVVGTLLFASTVVSNASDVDGTPGSCLFCLDNGPDKSTTFDLSSLPKDTYQSSNGEFWMTTPCGRTSQMQNCDPMSGDPVLQGCRGLGSIANFSIDYDGTSMESGTHCSRDAHSSRLEGMQFDYLNVASMISDLFTFVVNQ
eukprot:m.431451 g.431451  ORF g.431451 m.431451 type:complete len:151 (-) comp21403_c1_seq12:162-614(-)